MPSFADMRSLAMALSLLVLVHVTGACTLVGLGIGSYSRATRPIASLDQAEKGDTITIAFETGVELTGRFDGVWGNSVYLERNSVEEAVPMSSVRSVSVQTGTHWGTGMLLGAVMDSVIVGYLVYRHTNRGAY